MALLSTPPTERAARTTPANRWNAEYIEALYEQWKEVPEALPESWQMFFEGFELASCPRKCVAAENAAAQSRVASLIFAYRSLGHTIAETDPLGGNRASHPELALAMFDLEEADLTRIFDTGHLLGVPQRAPLRDILGHLQATYCRSVGVEYVHIQDPRIRRWLQAELEPVRSHPPFARERKLEILARLTDAEVFESFIQTRYPGQKRFSLEGAETLIPALHALVELAPEVGVQEIVLGMAHRGRLNVLATILDKSYAQIFGEFEGTFVPDSYGGDGDVKYHKGFSADHVNRFGRSVHLSLTSNPSHLEAVDPVVEGKARAKQRQRNDMERRSTVLPLLIHGDAAFAGQGVVAETLNLSRLEGYTTGGTVHVIVNNQIGFTTSPGESRSTPYATDVAKTIEAPIFHVNGDDPEAVVFVTELALRFRQEFGRDVVVDMVCYRRHGHNESDEPAFTQPVLYRKIKDRPSVRRIYTQKLITSRDLTPEEAEATGADFRERLQAAFESVHVAGGAPIPDASRPFEGYWEGLGEPYSHAPAPTAVDHATLLDVATAACTVPEGFALNPKVARQLPERLAAVREHRTVDWAFAEALSLGTLLREGAPVRLSGQDSGRGTFSQRHAVWQDMGTQERYVPLNHISPEQAKFCVYNSSLSEAAVLGFDYGYSLAEPRMLILWEAQFGDFANGAQVIIDQFIVASQSKWQRTSGLAMLLPHGYEGQGPEHSNAYIERYLAAAVEDNIQVCNLTTPANYFHALRRQLKRPFRRPLVVFSPKSLLRHKRAVSPVDELTGGRFREVLDDPQPPATTRRLVLCSGKVFYDLLEARERDKVDGVAIVRIEQYAPFPEEQLREVVARHEDAREVLWVQEEPQNRGAWTFLAPRLAPLFPGRTVRYVGRSASASPATGSLRAHRLEQDRLVHVALVD